MTGYARSMQGPASASYQLASFLFSLILDAQSPARQAQPCLSNTTCLTLVNGRWRPPHPGAALNLALLFICRPGTAATHGSPDQGGTPLTPWRRPQVDREGTGSITPEAIGVFLADLGLAATRFDLRHIMAELDPGHTGVVSRAAFLSFIRHGGRQPPPSPHVRCSFTPPCPVCCSCTPCYAP